MQLQTFHQPEGAEQAQIHVLHSGTREDVAPRRSVLARGRIHKCGGIKPCGRHIRAAPAGIEHRIGDQVRTVVVDAVKVCVLAGGHIERRPTLKSHNRGDLPAIENRLHEAIAGAGIIRVPDERCHKAVPAVEICPAAVDGEIVCVFHAALSRTVLQLGVFNGFAEGIKAFQPEVLAHAPFRRDLQAVVIGVHDRLHQIDGAEQPGIDGAAVVDVTRGCARGEERIIDVRRKG